MSGARRWQHENATGGKIADLAAKAGWISEDVATGQGFVADELLADPGFVGSEFFCHDLGDRRSGLDAGSGVEQEAAAAAGENVLHGACHLLTDVPADFGGSDS